jgi:CRISPR/Cas system-associated protein Csm6
MLRCGLIRDTLIDLNGSHPPMMNSHHLFTVGYKAECAVLYELGRALRLPVYYLHETFQVAVELP